MSEQQSSDTRQKIIVTKFNGCRRARKRAVAFLIFHSLVYIFPEQNARGREQNAAGGRKIYERPDQPTNKKHET